MAASTLPHDWFPEPLPKNVFLGERSWLHSSFAFRHYTSRRAAGLWVGHDTGLYKGTFLDIGPQGEVWIGDFCTLVNAIIHTNQRVEIHDYTFIAHDVVLADSFAAVPFDVASGMSSPVASQHDASPLSIYIGENAWIGARAILLGGAHIGAGSIVGAGAVVDFVVPPYSVVAGNPARIVRTPPKSAP
jgi:acetyltransferase-like isoleucine patch superfamily enzyme